MKINSISLVRFGSHARTDINNLGKFVVFLGANGNGKSTILDSIGYALTGVCRGIDDRGVGAEHAVTRSERFDDKDRPRSFGITLTTDKGKIVRGLGEGPKARVQNEIAAKYGINPTVTRALVQTGSFTKLPVLDQKRIILSVASNEVDASVIAEILGPAADQFDLGAIDSIEAVDRAERDLRAASPELKRQVAGIVVPEVPESAAKAAEKLAGAENDLREVRRERDDIIRKTSSAKARRDSAAREKAQLDEEISELSKTVEDAPVDVSADLERELAEAERVEAEKREKHQVLKSEVDTLQGKLDELKSQLDRFAKIKGTCPTCQRVVTKADQDSVVKSIKDRAAKDGPTLKQKKAELEKLDYDQSDVQKVNDLREKLHQAQGYNERREQAAQRKAKVEEMLATAAGILAEPEAAVVDTKELDEDIAAGEVFIAKQRELAQAWNSQRSAAAQKQELDARLQALKDLIEKLGPKGPVRGKFIEGSGAEFEAEVSKMAQAIGLGPVKINMASGFTVYVNGSPASRLSTSEEWRLNLAFSATISRRSGTGLLLLDGAEILDGASQELVNMVLEQAGLEQAFLAVTPADMPKGAASDGDWDLRAVYKDEHENSRVEKLIAPVAA